MSYGKFVDLYNRYFFGEEFVDIARFPVLDGAGRIRAFSVNVAKVDFSISLAFDDSGYLRVEHEETDVSYGISTNTNSTSQLFEFFLRSIVDAAGQGHLQLNDLNSAVLEALVDYNLIETKTTITYTLKS